MTSFRSVFRGDTRELQNLCKSITDCHHSTPKYTPTGKLVVRNFNIANGRMLLDDLSFTDEAHFKERTSRALPQPGDLIITREAPMGEVCVIPSDLECCLGQRMVLIKPDLEKVDSKYLLYSLMSEYVQAQIAKSDGTGSIVSNLRIPLLKELLIPYLELAEQREIARVLDAIDQKIDLNKKINRELEAMAKLIYDYWFVQFDFPDADGKPYKSSGGKMVYNEELKREIPDGWNDGTLDDLGEIVGGSTPSTQNPANFSERGIPWITPNDLSNNVGNKFITRGEQDITDAGVESASLKLYPKNTVLMSSRAPVGYMAIARNELTTNQGFKSFIPTKDFSSEFIFYSVKNAMRTIIQYSSGSTFKEIPGSTLKIVKCVLPKTEVANKFTGVVKDIFEKQDVLERETKDLIELRDWLLPMLMNGQVTVQDSH